MNGQNQGDNLQRGKTNNEGQDHANVVVLPPLLYLFSFGVGIAAEFIWPVHLWDWSYNNLLGGGLIVISLMVIFLAMRPFRKGGQDPNPNTATPELYTGGIFRMSRNPIYVSFTAILLGLALITNSLWVAIMLIPTLIIMHYGVIRREEAYLTRKFGQDYLDYMSRVRRWL
ncbi:MAG: isoprenylcysteine carboxyl methyltransferase [Kordiimonas sp.]|nr:isoprenylcysteine carboxyl methyltransferase [Kordiimonas sp.]